MPRPRLKEGEETLTRTFRVEQSLMMMVDALCKEQNITRSDWIRAAIHNQVKIDLSRKYNADLARKFNTDVTERENVIDKFLPEIQTNRLQ